MPQDHGSVRGLRRSDLARLTGCNPETVRYYESIGLLPAPPRDRNNYRSYDADHLARLRFVMRARDLGFSLGEIRGLLGLDEGGGQSCAEVRALAARHLENVRRKIADRERIAQVLAETVARCSGADAPDCPVIESLSAGR